jgi:hypothetical protein
MEHWRNAAADSENEVLKKKPVPVSFLPIRTPHGVAWVRTPAPILKYQLLTACAIAHSKNKKVYSMYGRQDK